MSIDKYRFPLGHLGHLDKDRSHYELLTVAKALYGLIINKPFEEISTSWTWRIEAKITLVWLDDDMKRKQKTFSLMHDPPRDVDP